MASHIGARIVVPQNQHLLAAMREELNTTMVKLSSTKQQWSSNRATLQTALTLHITVYGHGVHTSHNGQFKSLRLIVSTQYTSLARLLIHTYIM